MLFNSFEFVLFFTFVYLVYRAVGRRGQNMLLLAASYFFYGSWDWRFLLLLMASTVIDFYCGHRIENVPNARRKRSWLILSLCVNLGILGFFKYFNFFAGSLHALLSSWGVQINAVTLTVILPVGVSFYTFQSISYIVDVYRGTKAEKSFLDYALFVAFFPQLVAGPIERAAHMLPQYKNPRQMTPWKNKEGLWYIYWGFFLKVFVADNMAGLADLVFGQEGVIPAIEVLLGTYAFAFQIFGDFAGYSFIAMGAARLLGIDLMINFRFPYFVTNPSAFWRNWHISLSSWLRDYLYIPLGGNRHGSLLTYRNLFLTMLLGGLWHGAAWTFVIWGAYQGMTLIVHRLFRTVFPKRESPSVNAAHWLKMLLMFQVTAFGWLIFRAGSWIQLRDFTHSLITNWGAHSDKAQYLALQIMFYAGLLLMVQAIQKAKDNLMAIPLLSGWRPWVFYAVMFYLIVFWGEFGGKQFIYFQF